MSKNVVLNRVVCAIVLLALLAATVAGAFLGIKGRNTQMVTIHDDDGDLIAVVDAAIRRIDEGEYGYCEVTGEPISLGRLEARPIATMTLEAQERHERNEKISRED